MEERRTSRRILLRDGVAIGGALLLPGVLSGCGGDDGQSGSAASSSTAPNVTSDSVVVSTFGGEADEVRTKIWFDPFAKKYGARVQLVPWDIARYIKMAGGRRNEWDSIEADGFTMILLARDKLTQKLPSWVTRSSAVDKQWQDYASGGYVYSLALGYRSDQLNGSGAPEGWADFFDLEKYPGKRAFPKAIHPGTAEVALLADGVAKNALYPLDFDRAFSKLDTIKDQLLFYDAPGQGGQLMSQGSAVMAALPNGRISRLTQAGQPVEIVWNEAILYPWTGWPVAENAPHADTAFALIDWMARPENQAAHSREMLYGPTNEEALELLDKKVLDLMPNSPEHSEIAAIVDTESLADVDSKYIERYFAWVAS